MRLQILQPNPQEQFGLLSVLANETGRLVVKVLDAQGRFLHTITTLVQQGYQQVQIDIAEWNSGHYIVNAFKGGEFIQSLRVIKD